MQPSISTVPRKKNGRKREKDERKRRKEGKGKNAKFASIFKHFFNFGVILLLFSSKTAKR
jgi:hypothetical protein